MTKTELIAKVSEQTGCTKKQITEVLTATFAAIQGTLAKGEKIQIIGFGTFEVRERVERKGRNIQTGKSLTIPAHKLPSFVAGKALKEAVR